jgi:hypothetical protein
VGIKKKKKVTIMDGQIYNYYALDVIDVKQQKTERKLLHTNGGILQNLKEKHINQDLIHTPRTLYEFLTILKWHKKH